MRLLGPAAVLALAVTLLSPPAGVSAAAAVRVTCHGAVATIVGTPRHDHLLGTPGPDVIAGLGGNDRIAGRGGDDLVCGNEGLDRVKGGPGDDRLYGGRDWASDERRYVLMYGDRLNGGPGDDLLDLGLDTRFARRARGEEKLSFEGSPRAVRVDLRSGTATGSGHDTIRGIRLAPRWSTRVIGSLHDDTIIGGPERDIAVGSGGNDRFDGGRGNDLAIEWGDRDGADVYDGGPGDDDLYSHSGADVLEGGPGNDYLVNKSRHDVLLGGPGGDRVDQMFGKTQRVIDLGGGPDMIVIRGVPRGTPITGGRGYDSVRLILNHRPTVTLRTGRHLVTQHDHGVRVSSVDHWFLRAYVADLRVVGTGHRDDVTTRTRGSVRAALAGGEDRLRMRLLGHRMRIRLGSGDDLLTVDREWRGSTGRYVYGGPGHDRTQIDGSGNRCVSVETGTCPA